MATLWNRATPSQYRMLRAIAGAVRNVAHAHQLEVPKTFARSVGKRATGTLTGPMARCIGGDGQTPSEWCA